MEKPGIDRISRAIGEQAGRRGFVALVSAGLAALAPVAARGEQRRARPAKKPEGAQFISASAPEWIVGTLPAGGPAAGPPGSQRKGGNNGKGDGNDGKDNALRTCKRSLAAARRSLATCQQTLAATQAQLPCSLDAAYINGEVDMYCHSVYDTYSDTYLAGCLQLGRQCAQIANTCGPAYSCLVYWDANW